MNMKKNEFISKLDNEIIPAIREQILKAYDDGYTEGHLDSSLDSYCKAHNLDKSNLYNLGLPSGTTWIRPDVLLTFAKAKELGLQFPTKEQIQELRKCKLVNENGRIYAKGLNCTEIFLSWENFECVLWTDDSCVSEDFYIHDSMVLKYYNKYGLRFYNERAYAGDKVFTLFVLPDYVK